VYSVAISETSDLRAAGHARAHPSPDVDNLSFM
jgi:hypothetical protein